MNKFFDSKYWNAFMLIVSVILIITHSLSIQEARANHDNHRVFIDVLWIAIWLVVFVRNIIYFKKR